MIDNTELTVLVSLLQCCLKLHNYDIHLNTFVLSVFDYGKTSILRLQDDTVDHKILLDRIEKLVGLSGTVLNWFRSYLQNRNYFGSIGDFVSESTNVTCAFPQVSILGPSLFNIFMLHYGKSCKITILTIIAIMMTRNSMYRYHQMTIGP